MLAPVLQYRASRGRQRADGRLSRSSTGRGYLGSSCVHYARAGPEVRLGAIDPGQLQCNSIILAGPRAVDQSFFGSIPKCHQSVVQETGLKQWIEAAAEPKQSHPQMKQWPITRTSEQIIVIVAGSAHRHNFWMQAMSPTVICREIRGARLGQSRRGPARLGPGGDMCVI